MATKSLELYGLIGRNIGYSFSRDYFSKKFKKENLPNCTYVNFDIQQINELHGVLQKESSLVGFNVTIPYKREILPFLDDIDSVAKEIGAVNTVKVQADGRLKGFNTDVLGFEESITPMLQAHHTSALILGTGGASKAIEYVFRKMHISYRFISRNPKSNEDLSYFELSRELIESTNIIVNCTPLGTFPNTEESPDLPYEALNANHILYDLIYNPSETVFLRKGRAKGAQVKNGLQMLEIQAERAWDIWQKQ